MIEEPMQEPNQPLPEESVTAGSWNWVDILLILGGIAVLFGGGLGLFAAASGQEWLLGTNGEPSIYATVALAALESIALVVPVYLVARRKGRGWSAAGLRPIGNRWLIYALAIGLFVIPASGVIALLIQYALGLPLENPQLPFLAPEGFNWFGALGMLLFGGVLAPFAEELVFRGVLYSWLRGRIGPWGGNIASSLLFGVAHGDLAVGGAAFVLGIILAWAYERSGSLWSSILIHAINNGFKIVLLYALLASGISIPGV